MATAPHASFPSPPGRLGEAADTADLLDYLARLAEWRQQRRHELDRLDEAALSAGRSGRHTGDLTLAMALWRAVADQHDELLQVWDSGRADRRARERMSRLIWGRLAADRQPGGGLSLSLVEAGRLSDALVVQLRGALDLEPVAADVAARLRGLRAAVVRIRENAAASADATAAAAADGLDGVTAALTERARAGADIEPDLADAERRAARAERDVIVASANRARAEREAARAADRLADLVQRAAGLRALAQRCADEVVPAPRLGVPDPAALGPVPAAPEAVAAFHTTLDDVTRALDQVERAYTAPLAERDALIGLLGAYRAKASARAAGPAELADLHAAEAALGQRPVQLGPARALVQRYLAVHHAVRLGQSDAPGQPGALGRSGPSGQPSEREERA